MKNTLSIIVAVSVAGFFAGCGGSGLKITLLDGSVQKPSNVAVYFTVETSDGEPVAGLEAESFNIYEDEQIVSKHESKQTILNPEVAAEHLTILLVDMSGSVTESGDVPTIVEAAAAFSEKVGRQQKVAVYAFDGRTNIERITGFTSSGGAVESGVARLASFRSRDPSTNLNGGVIQALSELDKQMRRSSAPLRFGTLVVFTDGTDRASRVSRDDLYEQLDQTEMDIYVIGVGSEIDEDELGAIARTELIMTKNREEIADAFAQAADRIEAMSKRYYLLGYCSPARDGDHTVRIEANADGKSGSLVYEFNAKGFQPNCNPEKKPRFNIRRPRAPQASR
jgi:hypothetical protein